MNIIHVINTLGVALIAAIIVGVYASVFITMVWYAMSIGDKYLGILGVCIGWVATVVFTITFTAVVIYNIWKG